MKMTPPASDGMRSTRAMFGWVVAVGEVVDSSVFSSSSEIASSLVASLLPATSLSSVSSPPEKIAKHTPAMMATTATPIPPKIIHFLEPPDLVVLAAVCWAGRAAEAVAVFFLAAEAFAGALGCAAG